MRSPGETGVWVRRTSARAEPERLHAVGLDGARPCAVGLLRDVQDRYVLASFTDITSLRPRGLR